MAELKFSEICSKCGNKRTGRSSYSWCLKCLREYEKISRDERLAAGICHRCGKPLDGVHTRCIKCAEANRLSSIKRRLKKKAACVKFLGGKCIDCGFESPFTEVFDFHHLDPASKDFNIGHLLEKTSIEKLLSEVSKCALLCANCHRIRHAKETEGKYIEKEGTQIWGLAL